MLGLPKWWTDWPPARDGHKWTTEEIDTFLNGWFVREVLGHEGGRHVMPALVELED